MLPALQSGKIVTGITLIGTLRAGQIIIFDYDGREYIKRVSRVREGEVYVLGDNPARSTDSRHFGWVPKHSVKARVLLI